ncbi:MAG TPA: hypothetical protein VLH40_02450 [Atribacteraceae bacterium]|nr:hypothetical protein [Atribacteraceae bacterium]
MTMSLPGSQEHIRTMKQRYWQCTGKSEKTLLTDEAITITGYHRKYLIGLRNTHHLYSEKKKVVKATARALTSLSSGHPVPLADAELSWRRTTPPGTWPASGKSASLPSSNKHWPPSAASPWSAGGPLG